MLQEMVVEVDVSKYEDQIAELNKMLTSSNKTWEDREKQSLTFEQEQQEREAEALLKAERLQVRRVFAREERGGSERRMRSPAMLGSLVYESSGVFCFCICKSGIQN